MPDEPSLDFEVILHCDYCLNPISVYDRAAEDVWTRPYLHWLGRYICMDCALTVAGFQIKLPQTQVFHTQPVSLN